MGTVRVGIIGTGGVANGKHVKELLECLDAKIVALCDVDPAALERTAARAGVPAEKCYKEVLKKLRSDEHLLSIINLKR